MNIIIIYSSVTGNTGRLAAYLREQLKVRGNDVGYFEAGKVAELLSECTGAPASAKSSVPEELNSVSGGNKLPHSEKMRASNPDSADIYILAFWCRRSSMDDRSRKVLGLLEGKKILAVGTIGGDAAGGYALRVEENVRKEISTRNDCLGVKVCQGAVNMARIEQRRSLSEDDPHYVNDEKYERYVRNIGRPNEEDKKAVMRYLDGFTSTVFLM